MSDDICPEMLPLDEASAREYLTRGGWTKEDAILILNGLDPVANRHLLRDDSPPRDPMLATYWYGARHFATGKRVIAVREWIDWAVSGAGKGQRTQPLTFARELAEAYEKKDFKLLARRLRYALATHTSVEPWLAAHPDDPEAKSSWWTPARYFARLIVKDDPALAKKRLVLAEKVKVALADHRIYKRGGKEPPDATSIKNAFSKVKLKG